MQLFDAPYAPEEPRAARAAGVAMVFQHFSLFEALTVAENIALGMENPPKPSALSARITQVSEAYGLPLDPERLVGDLSAGDAKGSRSSAVFCKTPNCSSWMNPPAF
jgi:simple sugar transport system ATP-binding protein